MESWNIGIQRALTKTAVLEVRYKGNQTHRQWRTFDLNETNIFENGFLNEFKNAQNNLAIANGMTLAQLTAQPTVPLNAVGCSGRGKAPRTNSIIARFAQKRPSDKFLNASALLGRRQPAGYEANGANGAVGQGTAPSRKPPWAPIAPSCNLPAIFLAPS